MKTRTYPEPTCGALIFNRKGEIFLMKSHKWKNKYVIPGGHIELGESIAETVKREIKEETNLDVNNIKFLCLHEAIFDKAFHKKKHFIFLDFVCRAKNTKNVKLDSEAQSHIWAKPKKALELEIEPFTRETIQIYLKRKREFKK